MKEIQIVEKYRKKFRKGEKKGKIKKKKILSEKKE